MTITPRLAILMAMAMAAPAAAQERPFCADRPGLGTPACTVAPGRVLVETGLVDWTRDDASDARTDDLAFADSFVRIGVTDVLEAQVGWTPYGRSRTRDKATGAVFQVTGVGDVLLGAKLNFANPDGSGLSLALQPNVALPVGRDGVGAGDWGAALLAPVSYDLPGGVSLQATPQIAAKVDDDGRGRHLAWGSVVGLGYDVSDAIGLGLELQATRDDDPAERATIMLAGLSAGWRPADDWQLDAGMNLGLNDASDDLELYLGVSRRF